MNKSELGKQRIREVVGEQSESIISLIQSISPDFANYVVDFVYGDLFNRKGLSDKTRELAVVACLIGQGNAGLPLKAHLKAMLNVGWSKEEVIELLIFLVGYSGFPSCLEALMVFKQVLEEGETM